MTNEEFDRRMEFILNQQAQFASDIGRIEEVVGRLANASLSKFEDLDDVVGRLANASLSKFEDVDEKIAALVDSQIRLTESQAQTDEKLKNLISVVDRYFSELNGGSSA